ncbi:MAG TPA: hypothetical protein VGR16_03900 [Thermomicrobiales bacterium]|nr:hypothetical protein [Thermomicrobiales bacterium]
MHDAERGVRPSGQRLLRERNERRRNGEEGNEPRFTIRSQPNQEAKGGSPAYPEREELATERPHPDSGLTGESSDYHHRLAAANR